MPMAKLAESIIKADELSNPPSAASACPLRPLRRHPNFLKANKSLIDAGAISLSVQLLGVDRAFGLSECFSVHTTPLR